MSNTPTELRIRAARRRILARNPFFGTLALFADWRIDETVTTAATDGRSIWLAPSYAATLSDSRLAAVLVHELLHCALEHPKRRGRREPFLWNVAADIVVNGMIVSEGNLELPDGTIVDRELAKLSTEEVFEQIRRRDPAGFALGLTDVLPAPTQIVTDHATHWANAREQAMAAARRRDHSWGTHAGGELREITRLSRPELPWHELLWRFLATALADYQGFDRRFVGRGLYLEVLEPQRLRLAVAVDTSGSVNSEALGLFMSELDGVLGAYPDIEGELFFADAKVYGPFPLTREALDRHPVGGGGTSFEPFFRHARMSEPEPDLCIYFTDGDGSFPSEPPRVPTLWVVPPGGKASPEFPFGDLARLGGDD